MNPFSIFSRPAQTRPTTFDRGTLPQPAAQPRPVSFDGSSFVGTAAGPQATPVATGGMRAPLRTEDPPGTVRIENTPENHNIIAHSGHANAYGDDVFAAIDQVQAEGIGFNADHTRIIDEAAYNDAVMNKLQAKGYVVAHDGEQLVIGKPGNNFDERYDLSTWKGEPRKFFAAYVSPPEFAVDPRTFVGPRLAVQSPLRQTDLEGTTRIENTPEAKNVAAAAGFPTRYADDVFAAIDAVQREGTGFNADHTRIIDEGNYNDAVMAKLQAQGYKVAHDGEQLVIGREGFNFNERFDLSTWKGEPRKFYAAYVSPPEWLK